MLNIGIGIGVPMVSGVRALWTPAELTTAAWYDASDTDTITESLGSVSQWDDKSGNNYHATQGTGANQPIYTSGEYLDFDGTNHKMDIIGLVPSALEHTVFVVLVPDVVTGAGIQMFFDCSDTTDGFAVYLEEVASRYKGFFRYNSAEAIMSKNSTAVASQDSLLTFRFKTLDSEFLLDGTVQDTDIATSWASVGTNTLTKSTIGYDQTTASREFDGKIREIIFIESSLSDDDRQRVEGYLAHKWGLEANLPVSHPYKSAAPKV